MGVFKGFNIEYPRYTVVCPQTGYVYDVRSLNVAEVAKLKTSLTVPSKAPSLISKILWDSFEEKPKHVKTFEDFKKSTTLRDREALLYGLYHSTFGDDRDFNASCRNCGEDQLMKIKISKIFSMNAYPGSESMIDSYNVAKITDDDDEVYDHEIEEEIKKKEKLKNPPEGMPPEIAKQHFGNISDEDNDDLDAALGQKVEFVDKKPPKPTVTIDVPEGSKKQGPGKSTTKQESKEKPNMDTSILMKKIEVELPISKIIAIIRQPTIADEDQVLSTIPFAQKKQTDLINETLVIDKFEQYTDRSKRPIQVVEDREDILVGYRSLPPQDKAKIFEEFQENFGKYGIDLKTGFECNKCGFENELDLDIVVQFFRMVATA